MPSTTTSSLKHKGAAYLLTAKTNMHPGAGSESYGVIDNLVQRDPATRLPTINSTSLKGALREYFEHGLNSPPPGLVDYVFGADVQRNSSSQAAAGNYRFFAADLVSIPVRCNKKMYVNLTCPRIAKQMLEMDAAIGTGFSAVKISALEAVKKMQFPEGLHAYHFEGGLADILLEENDIVAKQGTLASLADAQAIFGADLVVASDDTFRDLTSDLHLPVVARNQLNNGISKNLWYEQILPRETRFWFPLLYAETTASKHKEFTDLLEKNPVQVGANASVGYGFCKIEIFPA